jgi:hypothetical protein
MVAVKNCGYSMIMVQIKRLIREGKEQRSCQIITPDRAKHQCNTSCYGHELKTDAQQVENKSTYLSGSTF